MTISVYSGGTLGVYTGSTVSEYDVVAGGDICAGSLFYSHHCENNDDATAGGGCSQSSTYKSWTKTGATYDATAGNFYDGAYSLKMNGYGHRAIINNTGNWLDLSATGSISMWYKPTANDTYVFGGWIDATHYIACLYLNATNTIRISVNDGGGAINYNGTQTLNAAGSMLYFGWDAATDLLQVKVDAGAWQTKTDVAWVDIGTFTSYSVGNAYTTDWSSTYGNIDVVKIYNTKDCT